MGFWNQVKGGQNNLMLTSDVWAKPTLLRRGSKEGKMVPTRQPRPSLLTHCTQLGKIGGKKESRQNHK